MKKGLGLAAFLIPLLLLVNISGFSETTFKVKIPSPNEEMYGTWVNEKYSGEDSWAPQKYVVNSWGYCEYFKRISDKSPSIRETFFILDKWTDDSGSILYRTFRQNDHQQWWLALIRISKDGKVLEVMNADLNTTVMNPIFDASGGYCIYYRQ